MQCFGCHGWAPSTQPIGCRVIDDTWNDLVRIDKANLFRRRSHAPVLQEPRQRNHVMATTDSDAMIMPLSGSKTYPLSGPKVAGSPSAASIENIPKMGMNVDDHDLFFIVYL